MIIDTRYFLFLFQEIVKPLATEAIYKFLLCAGDIQPSQQVVQVSYVRLTLGIKFDTFLILKSQGIRIFSSKIKSIH